MPSPTSYRRATPLGPSSHLERGLRYEQAGLTEKALAAYRNALSASVTPVEASQAHMRMARVHRLACNWDLSIDEARLAAQLADRADDADAFAEAVNAEVGVHQLRGDFAVAERLARHALERARNPRVRGILLQNLGAIAAQQGEFIVAERFFSASVEEFKTARYELGMAIALNNASAAAHDAEDFERALELATLAAEVTDRIDVLDVHMLARQNQAHALLELGSIDKAEGYVGEALGHYSATRNLLRHAECLEIVGRIDERRAGYPDAAARCYRLAADMAAKIGNSVLEGRLRRRLRNLEGVAHLYSQPPNGADLPTALTSQRR
jgi:tetratricopeptide (TPR) repeat protein